MKTLYFLPLIATVASIQVANATPNGCYASLGQNLPITCDPVVAAGGTTICVVSPNGTHPCSYNPSTVDGCADMAGADADSVSPLQLNCSTKNVDPGGTATCIVQAAPCTYQVQSTKHEKK